MTPEYELVRARRLLLGALRLGPPPLSRLPPAHLLAHMQKRQPQSRMSATMAAPAEPGASKAVAIESEESNPPVVSSLMGSGSGGGAGGGLVTLGFAGAELSVCATFAAPAPLPTGTGGFQPGGRARGGGGDRLTGGGGDASGGGGGGGGGDRLRMNGGGGRGRIKLVEVGHMAHCWQSHRWQWSSRCFSLHHGLQSMSSIFSSTFGGGGGGGSGGGDALTSSGRPAWQTSQVRHLHLAQWAVCEQ